nr:cysteine-rich CWC family protein [Pedobacter panaciterrae]
MSFLTGNQASLVSDLVSLWSMAKHEIIPCERCGTPIECKANSYTKCQCIVVQLNLNEVQYISELHDGCLCAKCLFELQQEYRDAVAS